MYIKDRLTVLVFKESALFFKINLNLYFLYFFDLQFINQLFFNLFDKLFFFWFAIFWFDFLWIHKPSFFNG
jgi:hypothetical protein